MNLAPSNDQTTTADRRRFVFTLPAGLALILVCQALLFYDVSRRGQPERVGLMNDLGRLVARNMTPLCWAGYLLVFDGLLVLLSRTRRLPGVSSIRARPNRFVAVWLTSVPVWCWFDFVNFYFMDAWRYHGLPPEASARYLGYFVAFAAISPGMFLAAQLLQHLGMKQWRTAGVRIGPAARGACLLLGVAFVVYPFVVRDAIGNLTLWVSLLFLLDPINHHFRRPSILGDWQTGRWGRTLALMAGGAICGFCWEFWNYWATAKWTYHLPFIGGLERYRYFEMPWIGFIGFLPFAIECWVVFNTIELVLRGLGLRVAEPLPDEYSVM